MCCPFVSTVLQFLLAVGLVQVKETNPFERIQIMRVKLSKRFKALKLCGLASLFSCVLSRYIQAREGTQNHQKSLADLCDHSHDSGSNAYVGRLEFAVASLIIIHRLVM